MTILDCIKTTDGSDHRPLAVTYIAIMSVLTVPLIPLVPMFATWRKFPAALTGAWIGGAIDSTGAVMTSASLLNGDTLKSAIVVKMLQNILIAPIALVITLIWSRRFKLRILWDKFPKFVLGFLLVATITTLLPDHLGTPVVNNSFVISEWFSGVSFVLIGFDIDLISIWRQLVERRWIVSFYIFGQIWDICSTLGTAYLVFKLI